jgi:hypothetical protein
VEQAQIRKEMMDHAWRYFELHASQRMSLFNFFLVLAALSPPASQLACKDQHHFNCSVASLGFSSHSPRSFSQTRSAGIVLDEGIRRGYG